MHIATQETRTALGGEATIVLVADKGRDLSELYAQLWRMVFEFERKFSRFLPDSELSRLNNNAGLDFVASDEFIDLLRSSKDQSRATDGLYNPFILPALQRAGYTHSVLPGYEADTFEDHRHKTVVNPDRLQLKHNRVNIPYGTALDMGGCGKGYLADQLADLLDKMDLAGYWVYLSGDVATYGFDESGNPWKIVVQNKNPDETAEYEIQTTGQRIGIATSGTARRSGHHKSGNWHHIIDPRSGKSARTDVRLATVIADKCIDADVLASCAVILGSKNAPAYLKQRGVISLLIQTEYSPILSGRMIKHRQNKVGLHVA